MQPARTPPAAQPRSDRRRTRRRRVTRRGQIIVGQYYPTIDCLLHDYSENGARLHLEHPTILPTKFRLRIIKTGEILTVRTIWRAERNIGVVFDAPSKTLVKS